MGDVDHINEYRERTRVVPEPIIVKKRKTAVNEMLYILVAAKEQQCIEMNRNKKVDESLLSDIINKYKFIDSINDIKSVIHCGNLNEVKSIKDYVYQFPQRLRDIREGKEEQFRCYIHSLERQKNMLNVINSCPTAERSWASAIEKVGSTFGLLLYIVKPIQNGNTI